jgi:hypothetical protein
MKRIIPVLFSLLACCNNVFSQLPLGTFRGAMGFAGSEITLSEHNRFELLNRGCTEYVLGRGSYSFANNMLTLLFESQPEDDNIPVINSKPAAGDSAFVTLSLLDPHTRLAAKDVLVDISSVNSDSSYMRKVGYSDSLFNFRIASHLLPVDIRIDYFRFWASIRISETGVHRIDCLMIPQSDKIEGGTVFEFSVKEYDCDRIVMKTEKQQKYFVYKRIGNGGNQ